MKHDRPSDLQSSPGTHAAPRLWHRSGEARSLGCSRCPELRVCGGLSIDAPVFNCMEFCCGTPNTCRRQACPNRGDYSVFVNEVGGLELNRFVQNVRAPRALPFYIPCLLDRGSISGPLQLPVVALPIYSIVEPSTGLSRFKSREELLTHFRVDTRARLVVTSTGKDKYLERFWTALRPKTTAESLKALRPDLIATPNFSLYCDTVRHDNLVSMKRIAFSFEAFANAGLPVALHVNSRTEQDFVRWTEYVASSPHISVLTYEFGTGGKSSARHRWHAEQLVQLAARITRPLTLLVRGGAALLPEFAKSYSQVIFLDTTALMKARHRRRGSNVHGKTVWRSVRTAPNDTIDAIFLHNVRVRRSMTRALLQSSPVKAPLQPDPSRLG